MPKRTIWTLLLLIVVFAFTLGACDTATPTEAPAIPTDAPAEMPTELNMASILISPVEEPWNTAWLQAIERVNEEQYLGLTINLDFTENVFPPDAERVLREYASSGQYDVIWAHSSYPDAVGVLKDEFPEIMWVLSGSGNEGFGGNVYWMDVYVHEPAYLMGVIAGLMTETDSIGAVAAFPFPNVNGPVNAYLDGAKSVNEDVETRVAFIESWFDPPTAKESALAQISAGSDFVYAERFGPFEAAQEEGALSFGHFVDQAELAPEVVVTSALALWDPGIKYIVDQWYAFATEGTAYNGSTERVIFTMSEGGADIAPYHDFEDTIPQGVKDAVAELRQQILDGSFVVPLNEEAPETQ